MADRSAHTDLAGEWQIVLDPHCAGTQQGWAGGNFPHRKAASIQVPGLWNLAYPDYEGVAFYCKTFQVGDDWADSPCVIHFEGASYRVEAWLNGVFLGTHEGAYTPFWFDLGRALCCGQENELVVRVAGMSKTGPVDGTLLKHVPASKQSWYFTHGGLWGGVRLERLPWISLQALLVQPHFIAETLQVQVVLNNRRDGVQETTLELEVYNPAGSITNTFKCGLVAVPGISRHRVHLSIPAPQGWSCETPALYRLEARLRSPGGEEDHQQTDFGMRDFTVREGRFFLNSEPVFLRGVLLQPHFPLTQIIHPDIEMMKREIRLVKEAGFNLVRCHIRPAPPGYLDLADRLGLMVYAETSLAWIRHSPRLYEHGQRAIGALIERDMNHPSVVMWGLLGENPPASAAAGDYFLNIARGMDSTRVVVDNSGAALTFDQDFGWLERGWALPERSAVKEKFIDIHAYLGNYIPEGVYEWLHTVGRCASPAGLLSADLGAPAVLDEFDRELRDYRGLLFFSELGGGGLPDLEAVVQGYGDQLHLADAQEARVFRDELRRGFYQRNLDQLFDSPGQMALASQALQAGGNARQIEALRCNPAISGYSLTQLADSAFEYHAGLLDQWRQPKRAFDVMQRLNSSDCLVIRPSSPVGICGEHLPVSLTLSRLERRMEGGQAVLQACAPDGSPLAALTAGAPAGKGIHPLGELVLEAAQPGEYLLTARLELGGQALSEAAATILVLEHTPLDEALRRTAWVTPPALLDRTEQELVRLAAFEKGAELDGRFAVVPFPAQLSYQQWQHLLQAVRQGATLVTGPLHRRDRCALEALHAYGLARQLEVGLGSWIGCYHWVPGNSLFEGLPTGFAGEAYVDVLPHYVMKENDGEVLAGSVRSTYLVGEKAEICWYSDIESIPCGQGRLVFCQYRCFDRLGKHPVARRLFHNLVAYLAASQPGKN